MNIFLRKSLILPTSIQLLIILILFLISLVDTESFPVASFKIILDFYSFFLVLTADNSISFIN